MLLRLRISGPRVRRTPGEGLIIAANHQSWIDPLLVQYAVHPHQITFLMTEAFFDLPVVGIYFRAVRARPLREDAPSVSGIRAARDALKAGEVICIFPEGALSTTGAVGEGRRGVAHLARLSGAAVVPLGIKGAIHTYSRLQKRPQPAPVSVRLGRPMRYCEADGKEGEQRFTERLMERIRSLAE